MKDTKKDSVFGWMVTRNVLNKKPFEKAFKEAIMPKPPKK